MNYEAFYKISYGLFVICSGNKNEKSGYIANTAFQVTAEPPQLAISCHKNNYTTKIIVESGVFSVSVLKQDADTEIIREFGYESSANKDKFGSNVDFMYGETGVPVVLSECIAWFECRVTMKFDIGTHILFVGEVINNEITDSSTEPLTYVYYRTVKRGIAPPNAPTYINRKKLKKKKRRIRCKREVPNVWYAVIFTIPKKGIRTEAYLPERHSKTFRMIGCARIVELQRICLKWSANRYQY